MPRAVICLLAWLLAALPVHAGDLGAEMRERGLDAFVGNSAIGATRDGQIWWAYFSRGGDVQFQYADGSSRSGSWKRTSFDTVCITMPKDHRPRVETCKRISVAGRGLDWQDAPDGSVTSQIIFVARGIAGADQYSYRADLREWVGRTIVARTLNGRDIWYAEMGEDGSWLYHGPGGEQQTGRYRLTGRGICFSYPPATREYCHRPKISNRRILWTIPATGEANSEIVYLHQPR